MNNQDDEKIKEMLLNLENSNFRKENLPLTFN